MSKYEDSLRAAYCSPETHEEKEALLEEYMPSYYQFKYHCPTHNFNVKVSADCTPKEFKEAFQMFQRLVERNLT